MQRNHRLIHLSLIVAALLASPLALAKAPLEALFPSKPDQNQAFIAAPIDLAVGLHSFNASYTAGPRLLYEEAVLIEVPHPGMLGAVELLATAPRRSINLIEHSAKGSGVTVEISFDGAAAIPYDFSDLVAGTAELLMQGHEPLAQSIEGTDFTTGGIGKVTSAVTNPECWDFCDDQCDYCVYHRCDYQSDPCDFCYDERVECVFQCSCPTFYDTVKTSTIVISYSGNSICAGDILRPYPLKSLYDVVTAKTKYTTKRVTEDCSHHTTTTVIGVTYSSPYTCYVYLDYPCSGGTTTWPTCAIG